MALLTFNPAASFWYTDHMSFGELASLFLIALSLSADCFAVSVAGCISLKKPSLVQILRTAVTFGLFQAAMPVIGWLIGRTFIEYVEGYDHWIAFGLLAIIGIRMIWEALHEEEKSECADISRGWLLLSMAFATSIDSLAVGLGFPAMGISGTSDIITAVAIIGVTAFLISVLGFYLGRKAGKLLGERAKIVGGIVLIAIGLRMLISHLLA